MRSSKALVLTIAWIGVIFVAGRNDIFICTDEFGEPSISDIVMNLIPNVPGMSKDPRVRLAKSLEHLDMGNVSVLSMMESALRISVPVKSFVSDGVFTLTYASANYEYTFNDVSLVQKKNSVLEFVCGYEFIGDTFSSLCDCGGGLLAIDKYHRDQYCVRNSVCSDKSVVDGVCKIMMNPFENGCLMISVRSEGSKEAQEVEDLVRGSVVFELVVPSLSNVWKFLSNFFFAQEANQNPNIFRHYNNFGKHGVVPELLEKIMYFSSVTLQNLPLYPINLLMGYLIVTNARDMTDSPFVQLIMQSMYGLFLAFIVLAYFLYRMSKRVMGRYGGPLAELAHIPLSFSILSVTLANPQFLRTFFLAALQFWNTGAPFGVWWLGKAYFLGCIMSCIALCRYFALFQPDSASWHAMHYSIKLVGLLCLGHSTSCTLLAVLLVLLGCFEDHLRHWAWLLYLSSSAVAAKPTYKYLAQKKMSMAEAEALGKSHTKLALQQLRAHLEEHPAALDGMLDRLREGGKKDEAQLVSRFVHGKYPGVPYTTVLDSEEVGEKSDGMWGWFLPAFMVCVGAVLFAAGVAGVMVVQHETEPGGRNL